MRNYAESIAYWYLRLNGFFTITDFVLHNKHGDTDILAIRPPFASEIVKGEQLREDEHLIGLVKSSKADFCKYFTCVIREAKGGKGHLTNDSITKKFDLESLKCNLRRLGLFKEDQTASVATKLLTSKWFTYDDCATIHKVLFAHEEQFKSAATDSFSFISLETAERFIDDRMKLDFKVRDWDKFNSEYIQRMILTASA